MKYEFWAIELGKQKIFGNRNIGNDQTWALARNRDRKPLHFLRFSTT